MANKVEEAIGCTCVANGINYMVQRLLRSIRRQIWTDVDSRDPVAKAPHLVFEDVAINLWAVLTSSDFKADDEFVNYFIELRLKW